MRVGIDCRLGGLHHAGIGRYIQELVTRLIQKRTGHTWVLFFTSQTQVDEVLGDGFDKKKVEIIIADIPHYSLKEQLLLPSVFGQARLDLLHIPHFNAPILYRGTTVVTIHDLLWHEHRGQNVTTLSPALYWLKYILYRAVTSLTIMKASTILVPADTIKKTITTYYPFAAEKIQVTYEAATLPTGSKTVDHHLKNQCYLLYVGSLYPHKNIQVVLHALNNLPKIKLVLVGSRTVFLDKIKKEIAQLKLEKKVKILGPVSDKRLATLYRHAHALVQPSLSEGFGLTGIEAMQSGTVVLASNIPIFKEIYGDAAQYFDPQSVGSFKTAVNALTPSKRKMLRNKSKLQLQKFSWDIMAQQTLDAYEAALSSAALN